MRGGAGGLWNPTENLGFKYTNGEGKILNNASIPSSLLPFPLLIPKH